MEKMKEIISIGTSNQSMETKGICIFLVNEDLKCKNIVFEMLQHCNYEVLHIGGAWDVLNTISQKKESLELVITNTHKLQSNGVVIIQHIQTKINLPIILMSPDKMKNVLQGQSYSFSAYMLNGLSQNAVNDLWQFAFEKEKAKMIENAQREVFLTKNSTFSSVTEANQNRKRKEPMEINEDSKDDSSMKKKPRVVWTSEMHQKFLEAINSIGNGKAFPKKILERMNIPGLTRENVASHLQKFRGGLKRAQEIALMSLSTTNEFKPTSMSPPNFTQGSSSMASLHQSSSSIARVKDSTETLFPRYVNTQKKLSHDYTNLGGIQFNDQRRVNRFNQQSVHNFQLNHNFAIYGDEKKDVLLSIKKDSSSSNCGSSFVGYRLTNNGNSIQFGQIGANLVTPGTSENQFINFDKQDLISNQNTSQLVSPPVETSFNRSSVVKTPGNENTNTFLNKESSTINEIPISGNDVQVQDSTENGGWDVLRQHLKRLEDEKFDKTLSNDQDFPVPMLELDADVNDFETFFDGISQEHGSSSLVPLKLEEMNEFIDKEENGNGNDDVLPNGTVGTCPELDWEEIEATLFKLDDK